MFSWVFSGWPAGLQFKIWNTEFKIPPTVEETYAMTSSTYTRTYNVNANGYGSWVAPAGITSVVVACRGGGGGGGDGAGGNGSGGGAGGGGGAFVSSTETVVPGTQYTIFIGAGGLGATTANANGANGATSTFNTTTVMAAPGDGGKGGAGVLTGAVGGRSADCVGNGQKSAGGNGGANTDSGDKGGGGGGAGGPHGAGGNASADTGGTGDITFGGTAGAAAGGIGGSHVNGGGGGGGGGNGGAGGKGGFSGAGGGGGEVNGADGYGGSCSIEYNLKPNAPSQDSPSNNATGVSLTPIFLMTATDADTTVVNKLSYKVTIYSESGCTSVVQTNDQAVSATGWTGTDASCVNNPTSCYNSGTQASFLTQTSLSGSTDYWWKASAKDPDGSATFTDSATCNKFTTVSSNTAPTISSVTLNGGENITLIEATATSTRIVASGTDDQGGNTVTIATSTVYRTGVSGGYNCTADDNNCYQIGSDKCVFGTPSGNNWSVVCTFDMWYIAESSAANEWVAFLTVMDTGGLYKSSSATGVNVNQLLALNITSSISYGTVNAGSNTGQTNATTTITNTGNMNMDPQLAGQAMCLGGNCANGRIAVGSQKYSNAPFNYGGAGTALSGVPTSLNLALNKPTSTTTPVTADISWGLGVSGAPIGSYTGTNSSTAATAI